MCAMTPGFQENAAAEHHKLPGAGSVPRTSNQPAKPKREVLGNSPSLSLTPVRILLVEDTPSDAELFTEMLHRSAPRLFAITHADCWERAIACLHQQPFDVLLLDLGLPESEGPETFLRARAAAPHLPIVALTGNEDEALALEAMRHGIEDFLLKGAADGPQLARAVRYAIERRRVEEALSDNRELLRAVIEGTSDSVFAKDLSGRYILANAAALRAAEKSPEELLGKDDKLLFSPEQARALTQTDDAVLALGKVITCEEVLITPTGGRRTYLTTKGPLRARDGTLKGVFGISHDVTEMKRTEKHLQGMAALLKLFTVRASQKEYLGAVVTLLRDWCDCKCVGVRLLDEDGLLPYAAHVGFSREFLHRELRFSVASAGCACFRLFSGQSRPADAVWTSPGGSFFCNEMSRCVAQSGEEGATAKETAEAPCVKAGYESLAHAQLRYGNELLGTLHFADTQPGKFPPETVAFIEATAPLIAEAIHKFRIEESLVESEARFRSMFERHASVMLLIDPETGAIVDANPAGAAFYGYSQAQLRGMNVSDLQQLSRGATERHPPPIEQRKVTILMHRLANGEHRMVESHSSPIRVQQRRLLFSIIHDITDRMLLQQRILETSEKERQRVGQDLHDSLGGKLTGAALMGKALAQKLAASGLPEAELAQEVVECINDSIRQTRLIARGLYPVDLAGSGLSGALAEVAAETARRSGIPCHFHADKSFSIKDRFVALHLFRLAMEAINNALRHAQPRNISVSLKTTPLGATLEVRDDGKGLPSGAPERSGLGLRTMQYRADTIGAQLSIQPGQDGGTIVSCRLPASQLGGAHDAALLI